jgi:hypothetical protein
LSLTLKRGVEVLVGMVLSVAMLTVVLPAAAEAQDARSADRGANATPTHIDIVVVRPGDSLWSISSERLGPDASARQIDREVERIYALNQDQIGPDPNLIFADQELSLPTRGEPSTDRPPVADRGGEPVVSDSASKKAATKRPVRSATSDLGAEPVTLPALPAAGKAVPRVGSLRTVGDTSSWPTAWPTVASLANSRLFAPVIIVLAVCLVGLLVWALLRQKRRGGRKRRSWEENHGNNYTRFDPFLSFEDTLRLALGVPDNHAPAATNGAARHGAAGNGLDRAVIFAAARARRSTRSPRRGGATLGVYSPQIRRHMRRPPRLRGSQRPRSSIAALLRRGAQERR